MEHALAVVDGNETAKQLVREAGELAAGVGATLTLLHVTTEDEYMDRRDQLAELTDYSLEYDVQRAQDGAKNYASNVAREVLDGVDVSTESVGALGDRAETILEVAQERECDHIFVAGRTRSPTGKALFGDATQKVILEFDGPVTVITSEEVE